MHARASTTSFFLFMKFGVPPNGVCVYVTCVCDMCVCVVCVWCVCGVCV